MQSHNPVGLLTAAQVSKSVLQGTIFNSIVKEQLLIIDKKILNASKRIGLNAVIYDLPITFMTTHQNHTDTKIMIYYHILKSLEERGYEVKLDVSNVKAILKIEWVIGLDKSDITHMEKYLQNKTVN